MAKRKSILNLKVLLGAVVALAIIVPTFYYIKHQKYIARVNKEAFDETLVDASQGNADAQFNLGTMYKNGLGVPEDDGEAVNWYGLAAGLGHASAQNNLGVMYAMGEGVSKDVFEAIRWWRLAAGQGEATSQDYPGNIYEKGGRVPEYDADAAHWWLLATDQGQASAQFNLGIAYYFSWGVPENEAESAKWLRLAAEQGLADAQARLGAAYVVGWGVPKNIVLGYMWMNLAAEQNYKLPSGLKISAGLKDLRGNMNSKEIAEAERLTQEWLTGGVSIAFASIVVLPFVNLSADAGNEYFSDSISEELINLLAQNPELRVIDRASSFAQKGKNVNITDVARELNVDHVLEGSVRKSGNRVRITVQLIEARSGFHLWSKTYDRTLDDVSAIQDEIVAAVVAALNESNEGQ